MILGLPDETKRRHDMERVRKLLISSAPARADTKLAIMDYFTSSGLYEMYGSTEAGFVTVLRPDEQFTKLGSVGRELTGSGAIKLVDGDGNEVPDGEVGELFSRTPYAFDGYWNEPDKTKEAFRGGWCLLGDLVRPDQDGYYHLVDRKNNMIISGGENVYPSEVENMLGSHPAVKDVAVVGLPDDKWGEPVHTQSPCSSRTLGSTSTRSSTGARNASPVTNGPGPSASSPKPTCPARKPAGSCTASCENGCVSPTPKPRPRPTEGRRQPRLCPGRRGRPSV
jgi:hypothetical protein